MYHHKSIKPRQNNFLRNTGFENSTFNFRREMNKHSSKTPIHPIFKHQDSQYMKWHKKQFENRETMDKLFSYVKDIKQSNERVNYRNNIDMFNEQIQRDNLDYNTREQLEDRIKQFKSLVFA